MSADSPRRSSGSASGGMVAVPVVVPPQVVSDRSILDSAIGFINEVTLAHQPPIDPKDTITWARFETAADISDPCFGDDWELEGNVAPPLLLILGYGLGVQVWAIPANGEAVEALSWRHGIVSALRVLPTPVSTATIDGNARADEPIDGYAEKRPLIALVDGSSTSGSLPQFCAVNFVSLKTGAQVKTIKFKNPVIDILANRSSVVITFHERIAIFDARTLEDRLSITTCYPSPGINPNPAALGPRWLAYAESKLLHSKRSGGGCDGDGVASYTATVLNASKSLVKGLRELGEHVAAGFTGTSGSGGNSKNTSFDSGCGPDTKQSGVITIIDIKNPVKDYSPTSGVPTSSNPTAGSDNIIAHFIAHSEALVAMEFDNSGMLLVTADRRGHDFHVFRIQPNPVGSSLAAVHHLYILHRGDTSAKVQNITLTLDSRWVAVSTLRGTTHVFPITPYGGIMGVRTHTSLHVVNKLSRFHRSAGLSAEGRSNSPISHSESTTFTQSLQPYHNSTLPPFPRPTVVMPLAQLRQPFALGSPPGSATLAGVKSVTGGSGSGTQRQRLSSLSDDSGKPLSVCAIFAKSRSWLLDPPNVTREAPHRMQRNAVDSLFVMAGHGALIQYDLDTKLSSNVAKEKICDDTPIELQVEAKAQWNLGRRKEGSQEIMPPLSPDNWLIKNRNSCMLTDSTRQYDDSDDRSESWLAQVEIITHAGPHRRLWMGPQFVFKTYNTPSGSNLSHVDIEAVEIGSSKSSMTSEKIDHTNPLNVPLNPAGRSSAVPVLIESGSYSSIEQSPKLMDRFRHDHLDSDFSVAHGDSRLKEDLADAMRESPSAAASSKDLGGHGCESAGSSDNVAFYDALTAEDDQVYVHARSASAAALAGVLPNIHSYDNSSSYESLDLIKKPKASIEKIVNPLGTVTTVTSCLTADVKTDILDEVVSQLAAEDTIIHENCDESLFRPVVAIFCDEKILVKNEQEAQKNNDQYQPPEVISSKLVVPVIVKEVNDELDKREKEKTSANKSKATVVKTRVKEQKQYEELSPINQKPKESDPKDQKSCHLKDNFNAEEGTQYKKNKPLILTGENPKQECSCFQNVCEKKKTGCSKNIDNFKEMSTEIKASQKICEISTREKEEKEEKFTKIKSNGADKLTRPYIQQKMYTSTKNTSRTTSHKTETLNSQTQENGVKIKNTSKISEENIGAEFLKETGTDFQFTSAISLKADHVEIFECQMDNNNVANSSEHVLRSNVNPTPQNLIKVNTAINEKTKESNESGANHQHHGQQLADSLVGIKRNNKQIEDDESNKSKERLNKADDVHLLETARRFVSEKTDKSKSGLQVKSEKVFHSPLKSKENFEGSNVTSNEEHKSKSSASVKNTTTVPETSLTKKAYKEGNNNAPNKDNRVETKNKGKVVTRKEQISTNNCYLIKKEMDLATNKISDDKNLNDENTFKECKDKSENDSKRTKINEQKGLDFIKNYEKDTQTKKSVEDNSNSKKIVNLNKKEAASETESKTEESKKKENNSEESIEIVCFERRKTKVNEEYDRNEIKDKRNECESVMLNKGHTQKDSTKGSEIKVKASLSPEVKKNNKDLKKKELSDKPETKSATSESESIPTSPQKKGKVDHEKEAVLSKKASFDVPTFNKENFEKKETNKESIAKKDVVSEGILKIKDFSNSKQLLGENTFSVSGKTNNFVDKTPTSILPPTSAWKTLSGVEIINKNLNNSDSESTGFPLLGTINKLKNSDKLLPEVPTPNDVERQISIDEFSILKTLDPLPPLPALEPLQLLPSENKSSSPRDISLINFESPLQENPALQRKITPAPRGFTEQNLILALCGSLHYENEQAFIFPEKKEVSLSSNQSSSALEDTSVADYKSLTEIDDPYMSLDQSSQDTNTTNTNTTNEKFFSSTNSSGSEEIVIMEEKKMTKKQKRKKQQQLKDLQKQKDQQEQQQEIEIDDEELRPLIAMTESQVEQTTLHSDDILPDFIGKCDKNQSLKTHLNTTDSDDPMPVTTSDDNTFSIPVPIVHNPHKIKTKKLEHKINLIAAIEAATSSSTSSAEESGVELGGRSSHDNDESLISVSSSPQTTSTQPLPIAETHQTVVGGLKKKTKRRKR